MNTDEKIIRLLVQLNKKTAENILEWEIADPPIELYTGTDYEVFSFYESYYNNTKHIGIYERRYQVNRSLNPLIGYEDYHWTSKIVFVLFDNSQRVLWEFSKRNQALTDLFNAVKKQVVDLNGLLNKMLDD